MHCFSQGRVRQQFSFLKRQFLQEGELPFTDVLSAESIAPALEAIERPWKDRIYSPLVTLWVFLQQVLSQDHSCRSAVAHLIAHRVAQGQIACSSQTGAYCQARKRLPEKFFSAVACSVGKALEAKVDPQWLWNGRRVLMYDGSTVTMPDTPANQEAYPQVYNQKAGVGFPIARIAAVTSLACGAILELGICRYAGKGQGEITLLQTMWDVFRSGDVLLTDSLHSTWKEMLLFKERGIDAVNRLNKGTRKADFRRGKRLGKDDHIVRWPKPNSMRSVDRQTYNSLPEYLTVRETRVCVEQPGFRTRSLVVVTTLLDPEETTKEDLAHLYRARWNNELDFRSIKTTMQMDVLRCKTPELVRKELWTHALAYNLIRTIMAQAASRHGIEPRTISFKSVLQMLEAFQPLIALRGRHDSALRAHFYIHLLDAIAIHRVGDRPGRIEPRQVKRRPKRYDRLMKPRRDAKRDLLKGVSEN